MWVAVNFHTFLCDPQSYATDCLAPPNRVYVGFISSVCVCVAGFMVPQMCFPYIKSW